MKKTVKIILKTRSPLHIAHPDGLRMDSSGKANYADEGFPCTAVQKISVPLQESFDSLGDVQPGAPERNSRSYPVIAANNIAGRMRRHAARHVLEALAAKGQKVSLHAYCVLTCGASTGKPDTENLTFDEYKKSRQHPYFGLFGGGPKMFERRLRVHNALPMTDHTTRLKGTLAHPNAADLAMSDKTRLTQMWGFRRLDDLQDVANIELAEVSITDFEAQFTKRQALILADQGAEKSARTSTKTYSAIEFVVPGALFDLTMELDVLTDAQLGLYLVTLDAFAAQERLGGYVRNGFGVVTLENVTMVEENANAISLFNNGRLDRGIPEVAGWIQAWQTEAQLLEAGALEQLIAVSKKDEQRAAKKAAAALEG